MRMTQVASSTSTSAQALGTCWPRCADANAMFGDHLARASQARRYIQNTGSADASRLHARLVDVGDRVGATPTFPDRTIRRLP